MGSFRNTLTKIETHTEVWVFALACDNGFELPVVHASASLQAKCTLSTHRYYERRLYNADYRAFFVWFSCIEFCCVMYDYGYKV